MTAQWRHSQARSRAPVTWLAVMGAATTLGSEPMVGLQWVRRMRARGAVTVLCSAVFRDPRFLPPEEWHDFVFLDTRAESAEEYAAHFARHLWRWWLAVRAHLQAHAGPEDRLLITVPAAIWMLPWVGGLPIPRERIFFGPMGVDWVPRAIRGTAWPGLRNLRTATAIALWRVLAPWLPRDLAFRSPADELARSMGPRFRPLAVLPEVEPPPMTMVTSPAAPAGVALLFDDRPRKRFGASLALALALAEASGLPLVVVGAPEDALPALAARAAASGVTFAPRTRMDRAGFQAWLAADAPEFVSLSASEGVPSTLIEALLAGCRVHVHDVGGIHWLARAGIDRTTSSHGAAPVVSFRWSEDSLSRYEAETRAMFAGLLDALDMPAEVAQAS